MSRGKYEYKLTPAQIKKFQSFFEDSGWKITWLSIYFRVHRRSILFHVRKNGWIRRSGLAKVIPKEIAEVYRERARIRYRDAIKSGRKKKEKTLAKGSYEYIRGIAEQQRLRSCQHVRWIKRCSLCGMILESDSINHQLTL